MERGTSPWEATTCQCKVPHDSPGMAQDACWSRDALSHVNTSVSAPRAAHVPEPALDGGAGRCFRADSAPDLSLHGTKLEKSGKKTVQAFLRAKKLPVSLLLLKETHDNYSSPSLMWLFNLWRQEQQCAQAGSLLLGAGRKKCDGSIMTWSPLPLLGAKLGLLSLGWLQGEGGIGGLLPM